MATKSLSRTGRFYDALRFLCAAIMGIIFLKLLLLLSSSSFSRESLRSPPIFQNLTAIKKTTEEIRADELAATLAAWTEGKMPDSVIHQAALCTPRDATDALLRSSSIASLAINNSSFDTKLASRGVIDIGANGGYPVTKLALDRGTNWVMAVEPDSRNFKRLSKLSSPNNSTYYVAVFAAASDKSGPVSMTFHRKRDDFSCVSCFDERRPEVYKHAVDAWTIDGLILSNEVLTSAHTHQDFPVSAKFSPINDQIVLLKTDTQGHEHKVLSGCQRLLSSGKIENAIVEFDPKLLQEKSSALATIGILLDAGMDCAHLRFAGFVGGDKNRSIATSFSQIISHHTVEDFVEFVNVTGKYTDLFCSKRPAAGTDLKKAMSV